MPMPHILEILLGCLATAATFIFNKAAKNLELLTVSVESLNTKIAVIVERVDSHEKRIDRIEEDFRK